MTDKRRHAYQPVSDETSGHFEDVTNEDLVLIAWHDGRSYSVHLSQADFFDLDDHVLFGLREHIRDGELQFFINQTTRGRAA